MTKPVDDKLRVYEYAKNIDMSSKEIITILKRVNMPVNNHMSVMEPEMVSAVENFFKDLKEKAAAKRSGVPVPQKAPAQPKPAATATPQVAAPAAQPAAPVAKPTAPPAQQQQQRKPDQRPAQQQPRTGGMTVLGLQRLPHSL